MILCCGEALIDFVPLPGVRAYQPCPGGSLYNVAIGLGRLETPIGFYCKVSTDFFGSMLIDYLAENNVDTSYCLRTPDPTTMAFVSLPSKDYTEPQFSFYANGSADRSLTVDELPPKLPESVKVLHFGSISLVLEPGATALETLMARESGNRIISLDPNVRPNLIPDHVAYRHRFDKWVASVDILKLSRADIGYIYPDAVFEECLQHWFDLGVSLVIQTRGEDGAEGFTASGKSAYVRTPKVVVADTVGAGDTFLAAMLAFLHQHGVMDIKRLRNLTTEQLTACLSYASQAAAINCSRIGANPPYKHELEEIDS
jgi:fructokinase